MLADAKNISLAWVVYGKLLCIQDLLSHSDIEKEGREEDQSKL